MANTGSYDINDLRAVKFASAADYGTETINQVLQADLDYYNQMVVEQMRLFAEPITEQARVYGTSALIEMQESDEFGLVPTKKNSVGITCGFPLRLYKSAWGITQKSLEISTPAELAEKYLQIRRGHAERLIREVKRAIYIKESYDYVDNLYNGVTVNVRRFLNADGLAIPNSPAGVAFVPASHTHYIARVGTLAASDIDALITHVTEHGNTKGLKLIIALADKSAISALSTGFKALDSALLAYNGVTSTIEKLDMSDMENQMIGYWNSTIEVWVKPYAVANYVLCVASDMPEKPLCFRQRPQASLQGLRLAAENKDYPLVASNYESEFGFGVWNRTAGAVLYTGGTSYVNPTISD